MRMQLSRFIFNLITQSNGNQQNTDEQAQRDLKCLIFPNKKKNLVKSFTSRTPKNSKTYYILAMIGWHNIKFQSQENDISKYLLAEPRIEECNFNRFFYLITW